MDPNGVSGRELLKGIGISPVIGALATSVADAATAPPSSNKPPITIAGYKLDRVEALIDGGVQVDGFAARTLTGFEVISLWGLSP